MCFEGGGKDVFRHTDEGEVTAELKLETSEEVQVEWAGASADEGLVVGFYGEKPMLPRRSYWEETQGVGLCDESRGLSVGLGHEKTTPEEGLFRLELFAMPIGLRVF